MGWPARPHSTRSVRGPFRRKLEQLRGMRFLSRRGDGRRILARLLAADAETFVGIARRMALGGGGGLASAAMRARIALATELPIAQRVPDAPLALALASRRDLAREWIDVPSTGSLPS